MLGEGSAFERAPHVPVTHMGYFKPDADAFISELRSRDRRSAKEWEYVNAAVVWAELGLWALMVAVVQYRALQGGWKEKKLSENGKLSELGDTRVNNCTVVIFNYLILFS